MLFVPVLLVPAEVGCDAPGRGACSGLWPLDSQISRLIYFPGALLQLLGAQLETDASVILTPAGTLWHGASIAGCHTVKCAWADSAAALTAPSGKTPPCWCCHYESVRPESGVQTAFAARGSVDSVRTALRALANIFDRADWRLPAQLLPACVQVTQKAQYDPHAHGRSIHVVVVVLGRIVNLLRGGFEHVAHIGK